MFRILYLLIIYAQSESIHHRKIHLTIIKNILSTIDHHHATRTMDFDSQDQMKNIKSHSYIARKLMISSDDEAATDKKDLSCQYVSLFTDTADTADPDPNDDKVLSDIKSDTEADELQYYTEMI